MDKFWKWMEAKGYAYQHGFREYPDSKMEGRWILKPELDEIAPTKQMLVGFMMEYCQSKKINTLLDTQMADKAYEWLEKLIERAE